MRGRKQKPITAEELQLARQIQARGRAGGGLRAAARAINQARWQAAGAETEEERARLAISHQSLWRRLGAAKPGGGA